MAKQTTIEDHFRAIEEAVAALEAGELPLEDALKRYEVGLKAVRAAKTQLDAYQTRLEELKGADA
jgi:exodeoxyribonuclease VII small subunit